jgi:hypothetical protein
MNRTEQHEQPHIESLIEKERQGSGNYPIVERTEVSQLGRTIIEFTQYDSEGNYIDVINPTV